MADTGLQAEEFGALVAQLEQALASYRQTYAQPADDGPPPPMRPGMPTPPGWRPSPAVAPAQEQKPYTAYNALAQPIGALGYMADNVNPLTYFTGPSINYLPDNALMAPVRTGYRHAQDSRNALLAGLTVAGQTMEAVSPALGPAEAPLYGVSKVLQAPGAVARATARSAASTAADLPHVLRTAGQRTAQAASDAASTVSNPLATIAGDIKAGVGDARTAKLYRDLETMAGEYSAMHDVPGRLTKEQLARSREISSEAPLMASEYRRLTGEDLVPDARSIGMYPIPEMSGVRQFGTPIINEFMPRVTQPQTRNPLLAHQPGPPMDARGLPDPRFQEGPPGVFRRPGQIPYEDNLDAQFRVMKGQQEVASPARPPHPLGRLDDPYASQLDRMTAAVNRGELSVESILRSQNPRQTLEAVAGRYGYTGEDGLQRFAGDLATIGGGRADLGIGRMVDRGPDNLFRTNPQWSAFDRIMRDARDAGRFTTPPSSDRVRALNDPIETPHGFRDPESGRWVSGPRKTPQGDARAQSGGFGDAPDNPLARRPRR